MHVARLSLFSLSVLCAMPLATAGGCTPTSSEPTPETAEPDAGVPETPAPDVTPTPDATPEPAPMPDVTPTPDATPEATPDVTPTPDATPDPTPDVTPTPDPTPDPTPGSEPGPTSPGCGTSVPSDGEWTLTSDGIARAFKVHIPSSYDPQTPTPLVLSFHGHAITANFQAVIDGLRRVSDDEGFIVVHPEGLGTPQSWNAGACCGYSKENDIDDVAFVDAMLERLSADLCIDQQRIYAGGLSNGGFMSYRLACERADRFAAVSSVAGVNGTLICNPSRPIPIQHFHGTSDLIVPYNGNFAIAYMSVDNHVENWRERNGCSAVSNTFFDEADTLCEEWTTCDVDAEVRLCTIDGGGHQWPGGFNVPGLGHKSDTVDASQIMWDFFAQHALP